MHLFIRSAPALAVAAAVLFTPIGAQAQDACVSEFQSDFINYQYSPVRSHAARNGQLSVLANDIVADDEHSYDTATRWVTPPVTNGSPLTARVTYNVQSGSADVETYLFGYGEAGIELTMTVTDASGNPLCVGTDPREELYIARYYETGNATLGTRSLECVVPSGTTAAFVGLTAHAWVTVGGASGGEALTTVQIVNTEFESCTGSCGATCSPATSAAGGTCFCDSVCSSYGDCCADVADSCQTDSCWEGCGGPSTGGTCWCDEACTTYGDCCDDKADSCG